MFVLGYGYGHPGAFNPFLLNSGWLDAAYLNYAWADYFRVPQPASLVKGKHCDIFELIYITYQNMLPIIAFIQPELLKS